MGEGSRARFWLITIGRYAFMDDLSKHCLIRSKRPFASLELQHRTSSNGWFRTLSLGLGWMELLNALDVSPDGLNDVAFNVTCGMSA